MQRIREILNRFAKENGCSVEEVYEQLDYCIDRAIENAYLSANEFAISFWEDLARKNKDFDAAHVILAISAVVQQEREAASGRSDSSWV